MRLHPEQHACPTHGMRNELSSFKEVALKRLSCDSGKAHGMRNELYLQLKWLDLLVQCSRLLLRRGEIELCESRSSRHGRAHVPRLP